MTTPKILSVIFAQDAAVIRGPRKDVRVGLGWDVKKDATRGNRTDTGQNISRIIRDDVLRIS